MQKIDTRFNLRGADGETITVTVNGHSDIAGVQCVLGGQPVPCVFELSRAVPVAFLDVNIDFNQAVGDRFEVRVTGSAPGSVASAIVIPRAGAFRALKYRFETV